MGSTVFGSSPSDCCSSPCSAGRRAGARRAAATGLGRMVGGRKRVDAEAGVRREGRRRAEAGSPAVQVAPPRDELRARRGVLRRGDVHRRRRRHAVEGARPGPLCCAHADDGRGRSICARSHRRRRSRPRRRTPSRPPPNAAPEGRGGCIRVALPASETAAPEAAASDAMSSRSQSTPRRRPTRVRPRGARCSSSEQARRKRTAASSRVVERGPHPRSGYSLGEAPRRKPPLGRAPREGAQDGAGGAPGRDRHGLAEPRARDPTPPAKRLAPKFAKDLRAIVRRQRRHWAPCSACSAPRAPGRAPATIAS